MLASFWNPIETLKARTVRSTSWINLIALLDLAENQREYHTGRGNIGETLQDIVGFLKSSNPSGLSKIRNMLFARQFTALSFNCNNLAFYVHSFG